MTHGGDGDWDWEWDWEWEWYAYYGPWRYATVLLLWPGGVDEGGALASLAGSNSSSRG